MWNDTLVRRGKETRIWLQLYSRMWTRHTVLDPIFSQSRQGIRVSVSNRSALSHVTSRAIRYDVQNWREGTRLGETIERRQPTHKTQPLLQLFLPGKKLVGVTETLDPTILTDEAAKNVRMTASCNW